MAAQTAILVVDDDVSFLEVLSTRLRADGYAVATAATGGEALELCQRLRMKLVIADWIMPGMDGIALCRALKADPVLRLAYFILLTAREALSEKVTGLDAGADDYIVKPCAHEEILARVRAGLRIHRLQEELAKMEWRLATRELAAALGHVINNPLAAIANYLELLDLRLRSGGLNGMGDILDGAHREVERIAGLVRRLIHIQEPRRIPTALGTFMTDLGTQ